MLFALTPVPHQLPTTAAAEIATKNYSLSAAWVGRAAVPKKFSGTRSTASRGFREKHVEAWAGWGTATELLHSTAMLLNSLIRSSLQVGLLNASAGSDRKPQLLTPVCKQGQHVPFPKVLS